VADKIPASILVVDDEPEIREIIQNILARKYEIVDGAENGVVALEMRKQKNYDLLIVDLNMPKMTGQELVENIRQSGDEYTAIIILTGHGTFKEAHELLQDAGISDFLNKPTDRWQLLFSAARALREQKLNYHLEELVEQRTAELQASQALLIHAEKMAALGGMVAGVAHEVNTPIGITMMEITLLEEKERAFSASMSKGIKKSELDVLLASIRAAISASKLALGEANRIISSFKQLAVDQTSENRRTFNLAETIEGVISALQIKKSDTIYTKIDCPAEIILDSFPGPLGQVFTNLLQNSLFHGFEGKPAGMIAITAEKKEDSVIIHYSDDGIGMESDTMKRVFDPFFTTKINHGGSGIGMSISFNLITEVLGGTITCQSEAGKGVCFIIIIPLIVKGGE